MADKGHHASCFSWEGQIFFCDDENVLDLVMMIVLVRECANNPWIVHFKRGFFYGMQIMSQFFKKGFLGQSEM